MIECRRFRWASEDDFAALGEVMFESVRAGPSSYTDEQRAAWLPAPRNGPKWDERLRAQDVILSEADGQIIGFMSIAEAGYIDFAYIRPRARHSGVFRELYGHILALARARGERRIWVHASLTAEPAFSALGFAVTKRERVSIGTEKLDRCEMETIL